MDKGQTKKVSGKDKAKAIGLICLFVFAATALMMIEIIFFKEFMQKYGYIIMVITAIPAIILFVMSAVKYKGKNNAIKYVALIFLILSMMSGFAKYTLGNPPKKKEEYKDSPQYYKDAHDYYQNNPDKWNEDFGDKYGYRIPEK